jgi:hypothetical protein
VGGAPGKNEACAGVGEGTSDCAFFFILSDPHPTLFLVIQNFYHLLLTMDILIYYLQMYKK